MPDLKNNKIRHAFTLMELLVVVGIVSIMLAVLFPTLKMMTQTSSSQIGVNTVTVAVQATHAYSYKGEGIPLLNSDLYPNPALQPGATAPDNASEKGTFSGYAALFTPTGRVRFMENDLAAAAANTYPAALPNLSLELRGPGITATADDSHTGAAGITQKIMRRLNGFKAASGISNNALDTLELPLDTGICGILQPTSGGKPRLIAPPFVVWYDKGTLVVSTQSNPANLALTHGPTDYTYAYINESRTDPRYYNLGSARPATYVPYQFDENASDDNPTYTFNTANMNSITGYPYLPFEKVEAVIGVITYSKSEFRETCAADPSLTDWGYAAYTDAINLQRWDWFEKNGKVIMFSRQSGNAIRSDAK